MELYIYDNTLNFKGIIDIYESLIWIRKYSKCGEFELHLPLTDTHLMLLEKENIIYKRDTSEAAYIEYINLIQNDDGTESIIVKGKFLTGYLNRRIIWDTENFNTTSELAIRQLINNNCINPTNVDRKINLLQLGALKGYTQDINLQVSYKNLLSEVESIASTSELGIRTILDIHNKNIILDVYKGVDRTAGQSINPKAIFSKEFENILEQEYIDTISNYKNIALIAGSGEGAERTLTTVGTGNGLNRFELFADARDLQQEELSTNEYILLLQQRGNEKLSENGAIQAFNSKINVNSNLTYKVDFDLGDIVTCISKRWGITIDARITEIEEVYEMDGLSINITFGNDIPTLIEKLRKVTLWQ